MKKHLATTLDRAYNRHMTKTVSTVSKTSKTVAALIAACFPQWKGRKVTVVITDEAPISYATNGWDGNTRTESRFYNCRTGGIVYVNLVGSTVMSGAACTELGWVVVEHQVFCGKDSGITIRARRTVSEDVLAVAVDRLLAGGNTDDVRTMLYDESSNVALAPLMWAVAEGRKAAAERNERKAQRAA